jgi:hypothetical protein
MENVHLRYCEDEQTGLPRLEDPSGTLSVDDLEAVRREMDRQFERLAGGPDGQILELNGSTGPGPFSRFRVTVADRGKRCPVLLLEAVEPPEARSQDASDEPTSAPAPGRWQAQFLAEVAEWLARGAAGESNSRTPLDFVLADLRALLRKNPHTFARLLFAGYLYVGDALSLRHGEPVDNRYARAAQALAEFADKRVPEGVLDLLLPRRNDEAVEPRAAPLRSPATEWGDSSRLNNPSTHTDTTTSGL